MITMRNAIATASMLAAMNLQAQDACHGPGVVLGVTGYDCASCGTRTFNGNTLWQFGTEAVVTSVTDWSVLRVGDVIQAVDNQPITTADGARHFSIPPANVRIESTTIDGTVYRLRTSRLIGTPMDVRVRR